METPPQIVTYDDCIIACYSELLETKVDRALLTSEELFTVSDDASEMFLKRSATGEEIKKQSNNLSHPFGRLCMSGLLDIAPYMEWALARERPYAEAQVEKALASKHYGAANNRYSFHNPKQ